MNSPQTYRPFLALLLGLLCAGAQPLVAQNEIVPNTQQGLVKLQRIWYKLGKGIVDQEVGYEGGPVGDVNSDGYDDVAIRSGYRWQVFLGGDPAPGDDPVWFFDSSNYPPVRTPIVGDFYGNGDTLVGFCRFRPERPSNPTRGFTQIYFYGIDDGMLGGTHRLLWDAGLTMDPPVRTYPTQILACDLDGNGNDELVIVIPVIGRDDRSTQTEIWIFEGGPNFSLDQPTTIITDNEPNDDNSVSVSVSDCDGDGHSDLVLGVNYRTIPKLKFWWGDTGSPWNWTDTPDRVLELTPGTIMPFYGIGTERFDYNGDNIRDVTGYHNFGDSAVFYLWLSDSDHDFRTRPFDSTDVSLVIENALGGGSFGYIGDSLQRYHMLPLIYPWPTGRDLLGLAGGPNGPNLTYDAYLAGNEGPGAGLPAGDVNGDGWEDRISASETYGGPGVGIALIIAGGPYIPNDDPTVGVREEPVAGETGGLFLWPNPVEEELHIAWKGTLKRMPARLEVHDMAGRLVTSGPVQPWRGSALWRCASVPSGAYLLTVLDSDGAPVSTATILKQ